MSNWAQYDTKTGFIHATNSQHVPDKDFYYHPDGSIKKDHVTRKQIQMDYEQSMRPHQHYVDVSGDVHVIKLQPEQVILDDKTFCPHCGSELAVPEE